jgi:DegV family protein with EDD domain
MSGTCILTDSSVQFISSVYQNHAHITIIPHHLPLDGANFPANPAVPNSHLEAPSVDEFRQVFAQLGMRYQNIVVILISSHLSQAVANANEALFQVKAPANIQLIDSQTTGAGLGILVQAAADALAKGAQPVRINRLVRGMIPHIYSLFCLQSLHNLAASGQLDPAQAIVGEMLGVIPFYVMDGGKLAPIQKARSSRQLVDVLHEFVAEFSKIKQIAILHGSVPFEQEIRNLRERLSQDFPGTPISEQTFGPALMSLFGPRSIGVAVQEHNNEI